MEFSEQKHTAVDHHFLIQDRPNPGTEAASPISSPLAGDSLQTINPEWHYTLHLFLNQEFMAGT